MVSDQEIASCVKSLLRGSPDPAAAAASLPGVVHHLEAKLGLSLSHKTAFIHEQIELLSSHRQQSPQSQLPPQSLPNLQNPYLLHPHKHQSQPIPQRPPSDSSPSPSPEVAVSAAAPSPFPQQHQPEYAYVYPTPPPLPTAAVVAAYNLQQQLQQPSQAAPSDVRPASGASKESSPSGSKRRGGPGGLNKACGVSPELQVIVGEATMPRTQIVKQLWAYIRKNNLQDPNNKRKIICNDELRRVFETDCTDMFKMNKLLAKHIISLEPTKDTAPEAKRLKSADAMAKSEPKGNEHRLVISDALAKFFGSEEREVLQSEATRRVLDYIKANQLEDSSKAFIFCDSKLQELFGCETFPTSGVSDMLANHLFKSL